MADHLPDQPPVDGIELSAFFRDLPDVEARVDTDYLNLRYSIGGRALVEHTLYLPHANDAERLADRISNALAAARRANRYPVPQARPRRPARQRSRKVRTL